MAEREAPSNLVGPVLEANETTEAAAVHRRIGECDCGGEALLVVPARDLELAIMAREEADVGGADLARR